MNRRAIRGLATIGVAAGLPLALAFGAAVAATAPGGSPAALVAIFAGSVFVLLVSIATFLALAAGEAARQPDRPGQGLSFGEEAGTAPAEVEGDHMKNRERR